MNSFVSTTLRSLALLLLCIEAKAQGTMPVPDIAGATVRSSVVTVFEPGWGVQYAYHYTINSPETATGDIWLFKVDVSAKERGGRDRGDRTYPVQGGNAATSMVAQIDLLAPFSGVKGSEVLVVGQDAPPGWNGGINKQGFSAFSAVNLSFAVTPGTSLSGFVIRFARPPTIRDVSLTPNWILVVEDEDDVTDEVLEQAYATEQAITERTFALGPLHINLGGWPHYNQLATDITRSQAIGWVFDAALVTDLNASLAAARTHMSDGHNGLAHAELEHMLDLIDSADPGDFTTEFRDLVVFNVEILIDLLGNFSNTFVPVFTAVPESSELSVGENFTLTMRYFNSALEDNPPIANLNVLVRCVDNNPCANISALTPGTALLTDQAGQALFSYSGDSIGHDLIEVVENDFESVRRLALVEVHWTAAADLIVPAFVPPMIMAGEGDTIFVTDRTSNVGALDVEDSTVTAYYISDTDPVDIKTATALGEREVPPLPAGKFNDSMEKPFVIPAEFTGDVQFLAACADSGNIVVESDESNNCSFSGVTRDQSFPF